MRNIKMTKKIGQSKRRFVEDDLINDKGFKISEYKRGFADGTTKQIEITKELLKKCKNSTIKVERKKYSQALSKALKFQREDFEKKIDELKNPYPKDVFTEPTKEQWRKIQDLFEENNFVMDRYFGSFGRKVWNNFKEDLKAK